MKGCRPLSDAEIAKMLEVFDRDAYRARNRALFMVGIKTGFRISELLSLTLRDVWQNGKIPTEIHVARKKMKGKQEGRGVPFFNEAAREALAVWIRELEAAGHTEPGTFLFRSREGGNRPLSRGAAWHMLKKAYGNAELAGKLSTHTLRKTFAKVMRENLGGDLFALQKAMGHKRITSTTNYIEADDEKIDIAFHKL